MFYFNYFIILLLLYGKKTLAKVTKKAEANLHDDGQWQGKWFPYKPGQPHIITDPVLRHTNNVNQTKEEWQGKSFPYKPGQPHIIIDKVNKEKPIVHDKAIDLVDNKGAWQGKWFAYAPGSPHIITDKAERQHNISCDDGVHGTGIDYDPNDKRHSFNYMCMVSNRSSFTPNLNTIALLQEHFVPMAYVPSIKCLNETINYVPKLTLPTYGAFRPLKATYGIYSYLPPQRWLRNLAEGAIVMLYHPCANSEQVEQLRNAVVSCMYRHIVTPNTMLSAKRPLALVAWGKSLEMSVVDVRHVVKFIGKYAKRGPLVHLFTEEYTKKMYSIGLTKEAHLVTDIEDSAMCGALEM